MVSERALGVIGGLSQGRQLVRIVRQNIGGTQCRQDPGERNIVQPPGPIEATGGIMNEDIIVRAEKIAEKYDDNFCMAASLIVQTLSDEIFDIVEAVSEDPIAMWRALVDRYERMTGSLTDHHGSHGTKSFGNYPLGNYPRGGRNGGTDHRAFRVRHVGSKKAKCHLDRRHSKASLGRPSLGALHTHSNRVSSRSGNQPGF